MHVTGRRIRLSAIAFVAALAGQFHSANAADLTVVAFGGVWEKSLRTCTIEPFQKKTGKTVDVVLTSPQQSLNQIQASPGKPPIDVIFLPTDNAIDAAQKGLVDKFSTDKVPNMSMLPSKFANIGDGFGVVHNYGAMGLIYNSTVIKNPPANWKEFVDGVLSGKWKASMPSVNYPFGGTTLSVWFFSDMYGGGLDNIEPGLDIVKKMRASGNMSFWSDPNQVLNALKSGEIDIAMYWDGRAWSFIDDGNSDFKYYNPRPGAVAGLTWIQKVKNSSDLAWDFINVALSAEAQSCFGAAIRYGVANAKATFPESVAPKITKFDELYFPPFAEIPSRQAKWVEAWNKEIH
jgi:putative spermidine/putrescine transport system substrate-binding protein